MMFVACARHPRLASVSRVSTAALAVLCALASVSHLRAQSPQGDAAPARAPTPAPQQQQWKGSLVAPDGKTTLDLLARFTAQADGGFSGTLDVPMQGLKNGVLKDIILDAHEMRFTFTAPGAPPEASARFVLKIAEDGRTATGTLSQGEVQTPVTFERVAEGQTADISIRRPQDPVPPYEYEERGIVFRNPTDGTALAGTLTIPLGEGPHPAVVLLSGSGAQDRDEFIAGHRPFLVLADHLTKHGVAVYRFDDRGVGGSGGNIAQSTCDTLAEDAIAAVDLLRLQPEIDPKRIGVIGHSEGGIIGPMAAARSPNVAFVVMLAGTGFAGRDILTMQAEAISKAAGLDQNDIDRATAAHKRAMDLLEQKAGDDAVRAAIRELAVIQITSFSNKHGNQMPPDAFIDNYVEQQMQMIQSDWFKSFLFLDPSQVLRQIRVPVLALIGSLDVQVPASANIPRIRKALEDAKNNDATVQELPGLNHMFQPAGTGSPEEYATIQTTIDPAVLDLVTEWIRKRTRLAPR